MTGEDPVHEAENRREFVPVMVPAALVTDVYGFIASRSAAIGATNREAPTDVAKRVADDVVWPVEQLQKLSRSTFTTVQRLGLVLDHLATCPDSWIPTSELVDATGLSRDQVRAIWTKLGRHLAEHYADSASPLTAQWGPEVGLPTAQTYYMIGNEQAKRWKTVRGDPVLRARNRAR